MNLAQILQWLWQCIRRCSTDSSDRRRTGQTASATPPMPLLAKTPSALILLRISNQRLPLALTLSMGRLKVIFNLWILETLSFHNPVSELLYIKQQSFIFIQNGTYPKTTLTFWKYHRSPFDTTHFSTLLLPRPQKESNLSFNFS